MHTLPKPPRAPSGFDAFLRIAHRGVPFTAVDGRAFVTVPALSSGYHTFPIRSRAFRRWFFDQCVSYYDTIPTTHVRHSRPLPHRFPRPSPTPEKIRLDLANSEGEFAEITPNGWHVPSGEGVLFETSSSFHRQRAVVKKEEVNKPLSVNRRHQRTLWPSAMGYHRRATSHGRAFLVN